MVDRYSHMPRSSRQVRDIMTFTLIELLVVVAIIGILASLLLPTLVKARWRATNVLCIGNLKQDALAIINFTDDYEGYYPFKNDKDHYWRQAYNVIQKGTNPSDDYDYLNWTNRTVAYGRDNPNNNNFNNGSLIGLLVDYGGMTLPANPPSIRYHRTRDGRTLGPTFICSGYVNKDGREDRTTYYGDENYGLASARYNNNGASSYDFFFSSTASWQHAPRNTMDPYARDGIVKKMGDVWNWGIDQDSDGAVTESSSDVVYLLNSRIMMADSLRWEGNGTPVESVHKPMGTSEFVASRYRYATYFQFSQNAARDDGSVVSTKGNATNVLANFAYLPGNYSSSALVSRETAD